MAKSSRKKVKPAGSSPGTVVYVGEHRSAPIRTTCISYSATGVEDVDVKAHGAMPPLVGSEGVKWYNVDGVHDPSVLTKIGDAFRLHPLVIEDVANTVQRPKIEDFGEYIFVALKMIIYQRETRKLRLEHVSIILGNGFVLSFLEDSGDVFEPVRVRIRNGRGQIRGQGADYLLYALIDAIVDQYFEVLEEFGEDIERVEHEVIETTEDGLLKDIYALKRQLITFRRAVWPLREAIHSLQRDDSHLVSSSTRIFLRDLYDHSLHVLDGVETARDIVSGMLDVYLSSVNNKMNQVMKVLTVMSSIFIPLTFIAGVYGMNFEYMPELKSVWGYPTVLLCMGLIAAGLLFHFRKRGWV